MRDVGARRPGDAGRRRVGVRRRPARRRDAPPCCAPTDGDVLVTDGPYAEGKEHIGGFTIIDAPTSTPRSSWGAQARPGRPTLPIEVRPFRTGDRDRPATSRRRLPRGVRPRGRRPGPPPRRHRRRRGGGAGRVRHRRRSAGRPTACRPARPAGSSPPPATGRSTGCAARRPAPTGTPRPRCCTRDAEPAEEGPVHDDRLRLIFTCCHPALAVAGPGGADAAAARRPDHRRDRARLPGARADDGAAAGAGQGARSATPASRTGCRREADLPDRLPRRARRRLPDLHRGLHARRPGTQLVREDLCAEAIRLGRLLAELMPDEPEVAGLLALMLLTESRRPARDGAGRRAGAARRPGPPLLGPRADRRGPGARARAACAATGPGRTRSRRRSTPCTATPRPPPTPTGGRSSRSTTSCWRSRRRPVVALQPGGRGGRGRRPGGRRWRSSTAWTCRATTCSTPSGPTCCAGWAGAPRRPPPTTRRSRSPATTPSGRSSEARAGRR